MGSAPPRLQIRAQAVVPGTTQPGEVWRGGAPCASGQYPPDLWSGEHFKPSCTEGCWHELARHLCVAHCPFLADCRRDADDDPRQWTGMVIGGHYYAPRVKGVLQVVQPAEPCWCPECV